VVGVCGGLQLLGRRVLDPAGLEGGDMDGLGLLDVVTTLEPAKTTRVTDVPWRGERLAGYEIHHGRTTAGPDAADHLPDGLGWEQGSVRGVYVHGLFENTAYRQAFLEGLGWRGVARDWRAHLDAELDHVAQVVEAAWPQGRPAAPSGVSSIASRRPLRQSRPCPARVPRPRRLS
jgi:adenosylcobyric acid synthase